MPSETIIQKDSKYWKSEIDITQTQIAELLHGEKFNLQSAKSDTDTLVYQSIRERLEALRTYLAYCENEYENALKEESGETHKPSSILYFEREYGY